MFPDPKLIVRDVECLMREVESLVERLDPSLREIERKVAALEGLRWGLEVFGASDALTELGGESAALRARVKAVSERLRAALCAESAAAPPRADATPEPLDRRNPNHAPKGIAPISNGAAADKAPTAAAVPPQGSNGVDSGAVGGRAAQAASVPLVQPPDPGDLEKIRALEEECEREFASLAFLGDETRHAALTLCAAKVRRLRPRLRDSYATDRRVGELVRRIVDLRKRYRLGWIDGCERHFDVPDWDAYVERCEETLRELRAREQARLEETRVTRERAGMIAREVERRGRELRNYLDTEEGSRGAEPEKLRAVLMSYLAVDGPLDSGLIERLRPHRQLFTGIAFRRVRKALERAPEGNGTAAEADGRVESERHRRVVAKTRGCRAVLLGALESDEHRKRIETWLALDRLTCLDTAALNAAARTDIGSRLEAEGVAWVLRASSPSGGVDSRKEGLPCEDGVTFHSARIVRVDRFDDLETLLEAIDRAISEGAPPS